MVMRRTYITVTSNLFTLMDKTSVLTFMMENRLKIGELLLEHLGLTFLSLLLAVLVSVPMGIYISRKEKWSGFTLGFAGILQTIPSIALLGFLLPVMGIGTTPAIFALFLYAILPIIRNTYTGIKNVPAPTLEAARGMGMTSRQILRQVEIPLAFPVLLAGIRTAAVINVGVATLAAYIGAGGLGEFIFGGITLNNTPMIIAGALPAALLALLIDQGLGLIQRRYRKPKARKNYQTVAIALALIFIFPLITRGTSARLELGCDPEYLYRMDGYPLFQEAYGISFDTRIVNAGLMYPAVYNGEVDIISGYSTDGRVKAFDLVILEDDQKAFLPYQSTPILYGKTAREFPEVTEALLKLENRIPDSTITRLNYEVDHLKRAPADVARDYLKSVGLYVPPGEGSKRPLRIASKQFTEHYITMELLAQVIEGYTDHPVERKPGLGGTKILYDALKIGELDLYPEFTGTAFLVILDPSEEEIAELRTDAEGMFDYVKRSCAEDDDVVWLKPLGFNNTYAMMCKRSVAERKGWKTISDLKR